MEIQKGHWKRCPCRSLVPAHRIPAGSKVPHVHTEIYVRQCIHDLSKRERRGKVVSSGNHCCSSALTTNAASFCTWSWLLGLGSQSQRTSSPPSEVTQLEVRRHKTYNHKKRQQTNLGIFPMQKISLVSYTEKKYSAWCKCPLCNYNLPHFHDFLLCIYYSVLLLQSFLYCNQCGCLECELLGFLLLPSHQYAGSYHKQLQYRSWLEICKISHKNVRVARWKNYFSL